MIIKVAIECLRPNNWFLNLEKLEKIREVWSLGQQSILPPPSVSEIDGQLAIIDGNTRVYVAYENGSKEIEVDLKPLEDIDNYGSFYKKIHRESPSQGIFNVSDLSDRILEPKQYEVQWIELCESMLK